MPDLSPYRHKSSSLGHQDIDTTKDSFLRDFRFSEFEVQTLTLSRSYSIPTDFELYSMCIQQLASISH